MAGLLLYEDFRGEEKGKKKKAKAEGCREYGGRDGKNQMCIICQKPKKKGKTRIDSEKVKQLSGTVGQKEKKRPAKERSKETLLRSMAIISEPNLSLPPPRRIVKMSREGTATDSKGKTMQKKHGKIQDGIWSRTSRMENNRKTFHISQRRL